MSSADAYVVFQEFQPAPAEVFQVDRHYLLYASQGAMRLEAEGTTWSLPPARAAIITAGKPITITLPQKMTINSALFKPGFVPDPPAALTVFEMTPVARELILECGQWGPDNDALSPFAAQMFQTLAAVTWRLAMSPSIAAMPTGRTPALRRALELTRADLHDELRFEDIAEAVGLSPRSLARRFSEELGMTWRHALRKMRMIRAIEELAAGHSNITQVAFAVGYNSLSAFNSAFRDFTGQTPSDYRNSFRI